MKKNKFNILKTILLRREPDTGAVKLAKIFKKTYFEECLQAKRKTASKLYLRRDSNTGVLNFVNFSKTSILKSIYEQLDLKHQCRDLCLIKLQVSRLEGL